MIYNLVVCIDNDDYGIAFPAGSHIDVVFLVRPTHYVPESVKMRSSKCYAPMSSRNSQMVKHGFSLVRGDQPEDIFPVLGGHQVEFGGHPLD